MVSQLSTVPILSADIMLHFSFGGSNVICTNFIRTKPKIARSE